MTFVRSSTYNAMPATLEFSLDISCETGFEETGGLCDGPGDWNVNSKQVRPVREWQSRLQVPNCQAIYRFEIFDSSGESSIYIGQATSLRGRLGDYVEMTRGLIALYFGHAVLKRKDPYRFVHFKIAEALTNGQKVKFHYYCINPPISLQTLHREELLEIADAALNYQSRGVFDFKMLNCMDSFAKSTIVPVGRWTAVQALL